jgi:hypothetical protein
LRILLQTLILDPVVKHYRLGARLHHLPLNAKGIEAAQLADAHEIAVARQ